MQPLPPTPDTNYTTAAKKQCVESLARYLQIQPLGVFDIVFAGTIRALEACLPFADAMDGALGNHMPAGYHHRWIVISALHFFHRAHED